MPVSKRNGLYVVEEAANFAGIDAALADFDRSLFLTYEMERGQKVYRVMSEYAAGKAACVAEWRNEYGRPLPLSSGLVELVKSLRPRDGVDLERAQRANEEAAARQTADFERDVDEIAADMGPRISDKRSAVLHRGQHLRLARARRARQ